MREEVQNREHQWRVRGTVKAAVLKGDDNCPNLIAASVYDTKPVHYLSMVSENIKWVEKGYESVQRGHRGSSRDEVSSDGVH